MNAIELHELDIFYGDTQITDNISFSIKQGESFALVGESGSGKSTILKAIMGLAPKWNGSIKVNNVARSHGVDFELATQCQMVFQDPYGSLHPRKTVDATLSEPLTIHGIPDQNERIEQVMQSVGLDFSFRFRYPHQLSGGQRQRVVIARALMLEPKILLLDEPTSALDVSVQAEILNLFKKLRKERGLTYLLVTHNLPVVSFLCDRLAVIKAGKLVEVTAVEQLRKGSFKHAYTQELYAASGGVIS